MTVHEQAQKHTLREAEWYMTIPPFSMLQNIP